SISAGATGTSRLLLPRRPLPLLRPRASSTIRPDARTDGSQPFAPRYLAAAETLPRGRDRVGACHRSPTGGLAVFTRASPGVLSAPCDRSPMVPAAPRVRERHGRPNGIPQRADRQPHLSAVLELPGQCRRPVDEAADRE